MILWGKGWDLWVRRWGFVLSSKAVWSPESFFPFLPPLSVQVGFRVGVLRGHSELWVAVVIGQEQGRNILHDAPSRVDMRTGSLGVLERFINSTGFL